MNTPASESKADWLSSIVSRSKLSLSRVKQVIVGSDSLDEQDLTLIDSSDMSGNSMLVLSDIQKRYQLGPIESVILKDLNLDVRTGDLVAIMGASGSGKSTLMNIMGLMDRPTSGAYQLGGYDLADLDDNQRSDLRARSIGFVFQTSYLLPRLTAWQNVVMPLTYLGQSEHALREVGVEMLERVGMEERADHLPNQLSGGQQQRVSIARALIGNPALILGDEPTGALDADTSREVMQLLVRLNDEHKVTIIIITHDYEVARQCKRVVHLVEGHIKDWQPSSDSEFASQS